MPKKYPEKLFKTPIKDLKWGVTPGGHVAHLIDPASVKNFEEISEEVTSGDKYAGYAEKYDANSVSHTEIFNNKGDNETKKIFGLLAEKAEDLYNHPGAPGYAKDVAICIKNYVTADGRQAQQDALIDFKKKVDEYVRLSDIDNSKKKSWEIDADLDTKYYMLKSLTDALNGGLLNPEYDFPDKKDPRHGYRLNELYSYDKNQIQEPKISNLGKFCTWVPNNGVLFPHMPSPNDLKQGTFANDCFMMASLIQLVKEHPEEIKRMMFDNGDGTATVRFWGPGKSPDAPKEPVYITVNKTEAKLAGSASMYASSSLWVSVFEKALIEYLHSNVKEAYGRTYTGSYDDINFGLPADVLSLLDRDREYTQIHEAFGFSDENSKDFYTPNADTDRPYTENEAQLFDFFKKQVNDKKDTLLVGNSGENKKNKDFALSHGIRARHAYTVMGVFEKDGKKFVQVRDPRGLFSCKYDKNGKLTDNSHEILGTLRGGTDNMGTSNIELKDFLKLFDSITGIDMEAAEEFREMIKAWAPEKAAEEKSEAGKGFGDFEVVDSNGEALPEEKLDNALSADAKEENFFEAADYEILENEKESDFMPDGFEVIEAEDIAKDEPSSALVRLLSEPNGLDQVSQLIEYMADDLERTSMFFGYKNTDNFKNMRDKLNEINKDLKDGKKYSESNTYELAKEIHSLSGLAETYADAKYTSIMDGINKGDEPSIRAVHRLTDAVNIMRLAQGETNIVQAENDFAESMLIVKNDIQHSKEKLPMSQEAAGLKNKMASHLDHAEEVLNHYIEKHPKLKARLEAMQPKGPEIDEAAIGAYSMDEAVKEDTDKHILS